MLTPTKERFVTELWRKFSKGLSKDRRFVVLFLFFLSPIAYAIFTSQATLRGILAFTFCVLAACVYRLYFAAKQYTAWKIVVGILFVCWFCCLGFECFEKSHQVTRAIQNADALHKRELLTASFAEYGDAYGLAKSAGLPERQSQCLLIWV